MLLDPIRHIILSSHWSHLTTLFQELRELCHRWVFRWSLASPRYPEESYTATSLIPRVSFALLVLVLVADAERQVQWTVDKLMSLGGGGKISINKS